MIDDVRSELELFEEKKLEIESAESERQSAELLRVENENQRNLTSVEEFVKLQDAVGGRNYALGTTSEMQHDQLVGVWSGSIEDNASKTIYTLDQLDAKVGDVYTASIYIGDGGGFGSGLRIDDNSGSIRYSNRLSNGYASATFEVKSTDTEFRFFYANNNGNAGLYKIEACKFKIEKGDKRTDWTPAPEDYTTVTKDDYYNHIKLMNERTQLDIREKANKKQEDWIIPTLLNGWVGSASNKPRFRKDDFGNVHITGTFAEGRGTIFTLPQGYRPVQRKEFIVNAGGGFGILRVHETGVVSLLTSQAAYVVADNVMFSVD